MTATAAPARPAGPARSDDVRISTMSRRRRVRDRLASVLMVVAFGVAVVPLGFVIVNVAQQGLKVMSPGLLTRTIPPDTSSNDLSNDTIAKYGGTASTTETTAALGIGPAIVGTALTTLGASALAIPLGILGAIYLHEYGRRRRLARFVRFMTDVMVGVPSVVMGVFVYAIWVVPRGVGGRSALAASFALGCLMLPIVVRSTEEMLRLVPDTLREASAALGIRTWRTTVTVVLPAAAPGIVSGSMLAVARAAGETAPVLFTIGAAYRYNWGLSGGNTSLSLFIYNQASLTGATSLRLAWAAALTLITIVVVVTLIARTISTRATTLH
ncbi:MAG: phosphate ABC transporter permease PstA [Actinobacteria bacterium]|nr:phosphate ABC transporter permease PstA [Actinomycetota bacterium]